MRPCWLVVLLLLFPACGEPNPENQDQLPDHLPFSYERTDPGPALSAAEVNEFTASMTGFWKQSRYFEGVLDVTDRHIDPKITELNPTEGNYPLSELACVILSESENWRWSRDLDVT